VPGTAYLVLFLERYCFSAGMEPVSLFFNSLAQCSPTLR